MISRSGRRTLPLALAGGATVGILVAVWQGYDDLAVVLLGALVLMGVVVMIRIHRGLAILRASQGARHLKIRRDIEAMRKEIQALEASRPIPEDGTKSKATSSG